MGVACEITVFITVQFENNTQRFSQLYNMGLVTASLTKFLLLNVQKTHDTRTRSKKQNKGECGHWTLGEYAI